MRSIVAIALVAAASTLSGCFFDASGSGRADGTLVVDWTVDGRKSNAACRETGADAVDIVIQTADGQLVDELEDDCETFALSIDLPPGSYWVDSTLLDVGGHEITTHVSDRVRVYRYESSVSAIDFPLDAFF